MKVWKNSLKKFELYKIDRKNNKVLFSSNEYGQKLINFDKANNSIETNGKTYFLSKENEEILTKKLLDFDEADNCRNLSNCAKFNNYTIYYTKINKEKYQFVCKLNDDSMIRIYNTSLKTFLTCFDVGSLMFDSNVCSGNIKEDFMPLYKSALKNGDLYVVYLIDYLDGTATKEAVNYINEYQGSDYIFVDREVYGIEDITDIRKIVLNRCGSMFGFRIYYELECKIDGKYYKMKYFPSNVESALWSNSPQGKIEISKELLDKIKVLTGQTEENIKTLKLLQVNTFLYSDKDGISKRSIEQQNKVFNDLSKVSLEDIKALPKHWQAKLSTPLLYDWLKCAGYSGDRKANEFVENLLKNRKAGK